MEDSYKSAKDTLKEQLDSEDMPKMLKNLEDAQKKLEELEQMGPTEEQLLELERLLTKTMETNPKLAIEVIKELQEAIHKLGYDVELPDFTAIEASKEEAKTKRKTSTKNHPVGKSKLLKRI